MAETELAKLTVKLEADMSSLKAEMVKSNAVVKDATDKMGQSLDTLAKTTTEHGDMMNSAIGNAFGLLKAGGAVAAAIGATKAALDAVMDAEQVYAINAQFHMLAEGAGLAADRIGNDLVNAASGLADDEDILQAANRAIVSMGANASKLPQIMEMARKATAVFGGDLVSRFEEINQAISSGQTRQLKAIGINVDAEAAMSKYAATMGRTSAELNEAGRQHAILNAVMTAGEAKFKDVDVNLKATTDGWTRLKVSLGQLGEAASIAFERMAGGAVQKSISAVGDMFNELTGIIKANFGTSTDQAAAKTAALQAEMGRLQLSASLIGQVMSNPFDPRNKNESTVKGMSASLQELGTRMAEIRAKLDQAADAQSKWEFMQSGGIATTKASAASMFTQVSAAEVAAQALKKLTEEGKNLAQQGFGKADATSQYTHSLEALQAAHESTNAALKISDQDYIAARIGLDTAYQEAQTAERLKEIEDYQLQIDSMKALDATRYADRIAQNQSALSYLLAQEDQNSTKVLQIKANQKKKEDELNKQRLDATAQIFGNIAEIAKIAGKDAFEVMKAASIAQTIIQGVQAVQVALASAPPPFNFVLAATQGALAAANVAKIATTQLATGIDAVPGIGHQDNFPAVLAPGERVVPKQTNRDLTQVLPTLTELPELMRQMIASVQSLNLQVAVQVGGRTVVETLNDELRNGRRLVTV